MRPFSTAMKPCRYLLPCLGGIETPFFRIGGPGLGNSLFPLMRCLLTADRTATPVLSPVWLNIKPGAWLRAERDKRLYYGIFESSGITGWRRFAALMTLPRLSEATSLIDDLRPIRGIINFTGMEGLFHPLIKHSVFVRNTFLSILSQSNRLHGQNKSQPPAVIHVRLGDFGKPPGGAPQPGMWNQRLPMEWYLDRMEALKRIDSNMTFVVVSDGTDAELCPLLARGCVRSSALSAVDDLQVMMSARVMVASASTFSMWASFMGRMPVLWHPGQMRQKLYLHDHAIEIETATGSTLPASFREAVMNFAKAQP